METVASPIPESPLPEGPSAAETPALQAARVPAWWRRAMQSGTGLAIAVERDALEVMLVRVRPSVVRVMAWKRFPAVQERPADTVGQEIRQFLTEFHCAHLAAHVLLPREDVMVRSLHLPGVPEKDLQSAVDLQLESLHPYAEQPVAFGVTRIPASPAVLVGLCRQEVVDRWISFFTEAGIKLAAMRISADVYYRAVRVLRQPPEGFLSVIPAGEATEVYGESPARPVYSVLLYGPSSLAVNRARSELRLSDEASENAIAPMEALLAAPESEDQARIAADRLPLYAAALGAATSFPQPVVNLLPMELRKGSNWGMVLPTLLLAVLLGLLGTGLLVQRSYYERDFARRLQAEVALLDRQVSAGRQMDEEGEQLLSRLERLKAYRQRTTRDMRALLELTALLPDDAWLTQMDLTRGQVSLAGESSKAGELLRVIDASSQFSGSTFSMPLQRTQDREMFRLRANRSNGTGGNGEAQE
jgi:Tfp pilus assembly protein PilN